MNENFPNKILNKILAVLFLDVTIQVPMLTIFHHNVYLGIHDERVKISNNKVAVEVSQQLNLYQGFHSGVFLHFGGINYLYDITLVSNKTPDLFSITTLHVDTFIAANIKFPS
jgi:hypothetical protein